MKLKEFYKAAIEEGIKNDPRGESGVRAYLKQENKKYQELPEKKKKYYDTEKLTNPYADSRIIHDNGTDIKTLLVGIDMEVSEVLLAEALTRRGTKIDAILAHHPEGKAYANFYEVMGMQSDIFSSFGVTISVAQALLEKREREVAEKVRAANHYRTADAAKLLDIQMMNMHTPGDNCVAAYLQKRFDKEKPKNISDIIDMLLEEKEYSEYEKRGSGPSILVGNKERKVKKVIVDMTGGTEGPKEIYEKLVNAGVDTVVGMHFSPDHKKELEKIGMNVVLAGHISSDTLGVNLILDAVEKKYGKLNVVETSGFIRVRRTGKK